MVFNLIDKIIINFENRKFDSSNNKTYKLMIIKIIIKMRFINYILYHIPNNFYYFIIILLK